MTHYAFACQVAQRSTCPTRHCGAVLEVVAPAGTTLTGYEGAPRGAGHCSLFGCDNNATTCRRAVRAEVNAILEAARRGISTIGASLYVSAPIAPDAVGIIINAGIVRVVCPSDTDPVILAALHDAGITIARP